MLQLVGTRGYAQFSSTMFLETVTDNDDRSGCTWERH